MLNVLALASISLVLAQPEPVQLGTVKIGTREVALSLPITPRAHAIPPEAAHVSFGGWKYLVLKDGRIGRRYLSDGLWEDVKLLFARVQLSKSVKSDWKVKVIILTRGEILEKGRDGIYRVRRATLEQRQLDDVYLALARLKAMAEGYSGGFLNLTFDVSMDDDPIRVTAEGSGPLFDADFLLREFGPKVNSHRFDTEDKVDRGPFDSIFVINAATSNGASTVLPGGQPLSLVSYYAHPDAAVEGGLSVALYREWISQLGEAARRQGYRVSTANLRTDARDPRFGLADPGAIIAYPMWSTISNRKSPSDSAYVARYWRPSSAVSMAWSDVQADPWGKLPLNEGGEGSTSPALIGNNGPTVRVRLDAADLFASTFPTAGVRDFESVSFGQALNFKVEPVISGELTAAKLGMTATGTVEWWAQPKAPQSATINLSPTAWGHFEARTTLDNERGPSIEVVESKSFRTGEAKIADGGGAPMFDPAATPIFEFWIKPTVVESYDVRVLDRHGQIIGSVVAGVPPGVPVEMGADSQETAYIPVTLGTWQKLSIDLRKAPHGAIPWEVVVAPPQFAPYQERQVGGPTPVFFSGIAVRGSSAADDAPAGTTHRDMNDVSQRAALAARIQEPASEADKVLLFELLKDQKELVRLNACATLTRVRAPDTVPRLIDQSKSASPQIAQMAIDGLAFQNTEECWRSILETVVSGPFDFNRQHAARQIGMKGDPLVANLLTTLMTSRSWHGRQESAAALGKLRSKDTAVLLISLLQEIEPGVRLTVTQAADTDSELVNRRLLWAAVNDSSEAVRGASLLRLTHSPLPEYKAEGHKGVRDESPAIRMFLLAAFAAQPSEEQRGSLRLAVTDSSATVRALALLAFAKIPGPVSAAEIENVLSDKDPRVQSALLELAEKKSIKLPTSTIELLKTSLDRQVAERAKTLGL